MSNFPATTFHLFGATALLLSACGGLDDLGCEEAGCFFTHQEWSRAQSLAGLAPPRNDASNRFVGNEAAVALGWQFYFEGDFSGVSTWVDTLGRATASARSPLGTRTALSCASCHNPTHAGTDTSSVPGHVSVGAGWYDVNSQQSVNAAYYDLLYWNGRSDSLWGQAFAVIESAVSMNGNRLSIAWAVADKYRAAYEAVIGEPLPMTGTSAEVAAAVDVAGVCAGVAPACPTGCAVATNVETGAQVCLPRFPLKGKPGKKAGCQVGDATEPFADAFDCMTDADRSAVTRTLVNVAKLIGAYEFELRSRNAPFDRFVAEGPESTALSDDAKRGLRLFVGRASCISCHNTPLFSDNAFHNIGVPQQGVSVPTVVDCPAGGACDCVTPRNCLPWGFFDGLTKLQASPVLRNGAFSDDPAKGSERSRFYTMVPGAQMKGQWRTPSLRDVALTAPYMHDGVYSTLDDVIQHYDQGGDTSAGVAHELKPLKLSARDRADLAAFLRTLTGVYDRPALHLPPPGAHL
ncbi:MAG: cytochrome c peroxidase [Deltaproteobacteria bacterium]|nr:cytochrome c peroxidase [Deltaproteobacteria bacterium]